MNSTHGLLKQQLKRYFKNAFPESASWQEFISAVNNAYLKSDDDREMLERILELSSQELLQANSEMRTVFEAIPDLFLRLDEEGTILEYKAGSMADFPIRPDKLSGKNIADIPFINITEKFHNALHRVQKTKKIVSIEYSLADKDQEQFFEARLLPLLKNQIIAIIRNITERKRAEEGLRRSEERYRSILDNMEEAYYEVDLKGNIVYFNSAAAKMIGYSFEELQNRNFREVMKNEDSDKTFEHFNRVYITGEFAKVFDWEFITKKGEKLVVEASVYLNKDSHGNPIGFKGIGRNITGRKQSEEALRQSEAKYRFLTEKTIDVIWTCDLEFNITFVSSSIEKVLGYTPEEFVKLKTSDAMTTESFARVLRLLSTELKTEELNADMKERTVKVDLEYYHKTGSIVYVENLMSAIRDDSGRLIGIHGVSRDITERKKAEEEKKKLENQLAQVQKMESIGTLAGGIAHDFNNILSIIIGYTELAVNDLSKPEKARVELKEVLKAGDRAKDLVSQILTFSRQSETKHSPLALATIIKESLKMLRSIIPSTIELKQNIIDSGLIMSDPTQINQIMLNLCTNAAHAMDRTGGVLEVGMERVHIDGTTETRGLDLADGSYLMISVRDTGHGMPPEVIARIFDPYFTTKDVGRGTGLGLAVVHGIVKSHGGAIICDSAVGKGTRFRVYLPEIESGKETLLSSDTGPFPTGTECILFVDDEPILSALAKRMMEDLGYVVHIRTSSIEALEFFRNSPGKFDLVITDMTMPGMTGDTLTQRIKEIRPDIPVILCTGYSEHITEERAKRIGIREFIMKPLIMKDMARIIRGVLDRRK
ncbi:MAG: PAS domain S-box protein [Deltaproteobacteria bacterium]|nr:PAS domain S-box protein [Deltaproteobacteria bacterium]